MLATCRNVVFAGKTNSRRLSDFVKVVEVGPRDGLQNEAKIVPTATKVALVDKLSETGLRFIEVTSFVSPKWVPQMADNAKVFREIRKKPGVSYPVLVPNLQGLESALEAGASEVAIFASASEAFSRRNINCSIAESVQRFAMVQERCKEVNVRVRAYVSCVVGCPYEGEVKPKVVTSLVESLLASGCYEVSLGDTIGVGTPKKVGELLMELMTLSGHLDQLAVHCHDTYGQALANVYESLDRGVRVFDSSVAGLGGCPYAKGASGNVATEDLLYLLKGQGMDTGVDLEKMVDVGEFISGELGRRNLSKVGSATLAK